MESKKLYNIENDTLIILSPKSLGLTVKNNFTQSFFLEISQFTVLYFLCAAHPNAVEFADFKNIMKDLGLVYPGNKKFIVQMSHLKKLLSSYGVKDLIIKIRDYGYIISNKWVPPEQNTMVSRKQRFADFTKLVGLIFPYIKE